MPTTPITIAVCDDQPEERAKIISLIQEYTEKEQRIVNIHEFESGESFLSSDISAYHLIFLDIFMNGINGMETARRLFSQNSRVQIVFCSTSAEFAAESYDVEALHYLVKPIHREKFFQVLDRFFRLYRSMKTITVKVQRVDTTFYVSDILWVEAADHKCIIHTKQEDAETRMAFSQLCSELLPFDFIQPIRYAVVSLKEITAIPTDKLTLSDGSVIPISRGERMKVKQAFTDYKWRMMLGRTEE